MARAIVHLLEGLATIAIVFPAVSQRRRFALIQAWSARLLRIFALEIRQTGTVHAHANRGLVLVANHVSWLDIFVIDAVQPARFVAKDELRRWPVVGLLIAGVGTLFIDRSTRRHVHGANAMVEAALRSGDVVAIFPEGRVNDGDVLPFHGSLLQPAIETGSAVQPVAIRYCGPDGRPTRAAAFADLTFLGSVWQVTSAPCLAVELTLLPLVSGPQRHRREVAREAEALIRAAVGPPTGGSAPGTAADPGGTSR